MFYDIEQFPLLQKIKANNSIINEELASAMEKNKLIFDTLSPISDNIEHYTDYWAKDNGFHSEQIGYDVRNGKYSALGIYKKNFPIKHFNALEFFPKTLQMVQSIRGLHYAGFFLMHPHSGIKAHKHNRKHLIFHLLLNDLENGDFLLKCNEESRRIKSAGEYLLFDYSYEHESANFSDSERFNFIVDFEME